MASKSEKKEGKEGRRAGKRVATTRSTAGPGFDFEDQVSALLLVRMLSGEPLPAVSATGIQIQAQTAALGWLIDDLLVTGSRDGAAQRLAVSCKSNMQVTKNGLPTEFVGAALAMWRNASGPFNHQTDQLALATRGRHDEFETAWADIKNWCDGADPALALARIKASQKHQTIFDSLRRPAGAEPLSDTDAIEMARRLHVVPFDFQLADSKDRTHAIGQCRQLLTSRDLGQAEDLWKTLVDVAGNIRLGAGTLTLADLIGQLRKKFTLQPHPDFAVSLAALSNVTADYRDSIETGLSTGFTLERTVPASRLEALLTAGPITVVFGDSGVGKSALVKATLDARFSTWNQVWLGPEEFATALSATKRSLLSLTRPLEDILAATPYANNVLVLDSAERIGVNEFTAAKRLVDRLRATIASDDAPVWRVVVISQTQSWAETSHRLLGAAVPEVVTVDPLKREEVRDALRSSQALRWLLAHEDTVAALTNLRTLFWVIQAGAAMGSDSGTLTSHTAVADRLWQFWTGGRIDLHGLMMRLAKREANFERSFAVSELDPSDAMIFQAKPNQLPLAVRRNRIEFNHDLAADWARFQALKEVADEVHKWAAYASNPLWTGALRMLGQCLLRETANSETAWDVAFRAVEADGPPLAADLLLDALCLDPEAGRFLNERAELLLANGGARLSRLLVRFQHLASVPSGAPALLNLNPSLGLYFEANFRSLLHGRWPPLAHFLNQHEARVADLKLPAVSKTCEAWLNGTPLEASGAPFSYRQEFAQLALATARAIQADKEVGTIYIGRDENPYFGAALLGAQDIPEEIAQWALEMSGRRDVSEAIKSKAAEERRKRDEERAERLRTDPDYRRKQEERARRASDMPRMISSRHSLPAWPLGPARKVDYDFREAAFRPNALAALMKIRPDAATEVLVALHIEDDPEEDFNSSLDEAELGLANLRDTSPTAFWKSPFFQFLQIAPEHAIGAIIQLTNFAMERWQIYRKRSQDRPLPELSIRIDDQEWKYLGGRSTFGWGQSNSIQNGSLFSALDALERWLTLQLEQGLNCSSHIERLLREAKSVAILGVLVNVAKFRPTLLSSDLAALLANPAFFEWDSERVQNIGYSFIGWSWAQSGDVVFEFAKAWAFAPHRKVTLLDVSLELVRTDAEAASLVKRAVAGWPIPVDERASLNMRLHQAWLDRDNYKPSSEAALDLEFRVPDDLAAEIEAYNQARSGKHSAFVLPFRCQEWVEKRVSFSAEDAQRAADWLAQIEADDSLDPEIKVRNQLALCAALIVCAYEWAKARPDLFSHLCKVIEAAALKAAENAQEIRRSRIGGSSEAIACWGHAVMHLWMNDAESQGLWEPQVLRLMSSGDSRAIDIVTETAYVHRDQLGDAWWRLLQLGLLWSGLVMLAPRYDDAGVTLAVWDRWLQRFRQMKITGVPTDGQSLDVERIAEGYERLEFDGWRREYEADEKGWRYRDPDGRRSAGLETHFLDKLFGWLLNHEWPLGREAFQTEREITRRLWSLEVRHMASHANDKGEFALPSPLGYSLVTKFASMAVLAPAETAREIWEPVLALGNDAHAAIDQFLSHFMSLPGRCDPQKFTAVWREMLSHGLDQKWEERDRWYRGEAYLRSLLGFGYENALAKLPNRAVVIAGLKNLYERWVKTHLTLEEDNVAGFANFLTTEFGAALRLEGIQWIATAMSDKAQRLSWYRDRAGPALVDLLDTAVTINSAELSRNHAALDAVMAIGAELASRNVNAALALQERIKLLR